MRSISVLDSSGRRVFSPIRKALRGDFVRHGALVFGATMLTNVLSYLFNFAISRRLGVEGYAVVSSLIGLLYILSIPSTILNLIVVKYTAEFHAVGDTARVWLFSRVLMKLTAVSAVIVFAIGLLLRGPLAHYLRITDERTIVLTVAILSLTLINPSVRGILQGEQDFARFSASIALEAFLKAALAIAIVYAGGGVLGAMLGWLGATACALAYTIWAVGRHRAPLDENVRLMFDYNRLLKTMTGVGLATSSLTLLSFMDLLLVKHYFNAHDAGLYAAVNMSGKVVLFLVAFLPAIVIPKAVARVKSGESPTPILIQAGIGTIFMAGTVLAVFGLAPVTVIRLLAGRAFVGAAPYVFQYDVAIGLLAIVTLVVNYKIALHRFSFLYPLILILAGEIVAVALRHGTLWDVIHVLLVGNAAMCIASLLSVSGRSRRVRSDLAEAA